MCKVLLIVCSIFYSSLQAGYCFKNDSDASCFVTMYDQDNDLVIDRFNLLANQEFILSCNYLRKQKIKVLKIFHDQNDDTDTTCATICVNCPNCYYLLYNLKGALLSHENSKTAVALFKSNLNDCIFIKRGFIQKGYFLRNIEDKKDLIITVKNEKDKTILENFSLAPNGELFFSDSTLKRSDIEKKIKLRFVSDYRSNETKKRIPLLDTEIPSRTVSFDSQVIYPLAIGFGCIPFRVGMNQFNEATQKSPNDHPYLKHFLAKTLFNKPRTNNPMRFGELSTEKKQKYADIVFENCSNDKHELQILDQRDEIVIESMILLPQERVHFASSYLRDQSIHSLKLITRIVTDEKENEPEESIAHQCTLIMSSKTSQNYCEEYTIFGDWLATHDFQKFQEIVQPKIFTSYFIKRGFLNLGYSIRNIEKEDLEISMKDQHGRILFDHYVMPSNSEFYFSKKYLDREKIEYILVTAHMQSSAIQTKNSKGKITLITTPRYNFDSQKVYNLALGLKSLAIQFPLNQFNELSHKPLSIQGKMSDSLYYQTVFYEPRSHEPVRMKSTSMHSMQTEKEVEGPISPSTKI